MLDALFKPKSVAVIGASNNPLSIGHTVLQNLMDYNFKGPIYPINPKSKYIRNLKAYASITEVPDNVELVNISIKNTLIPSVIEECGRKGVKIAIVHTAGFKEVGEKGLDLEKQIVEIAHRYGMRIYGPNSQGVQNSDPLISLYANFTFTPMTPGNISIVAQSGGIGETLNLHLFKHGVGIRMYSSFGNEADISMNEIIEYYGHDEGTKLIMVHIETIKNPAGFLKVAERVTPRKPILALKTGKTSEGIKAIASHTGAFIQQEEITEAIFKKSGILRFHSQEDMIDAATAFSSQPVPKGKKVAIITNTGGPAIAAVDVCSVGGLELAELSLKTKEHLNKLLFKEAAVSNPVDLVATAGPEQYGGTLEALIKDKNVDSILLNFITPKFIDCEEVARKLVSISKSSIKPILYVVMTIGKGNEVVRILRNNRLPVYDYPETASKVLSLMTEYGRIFQKGTLFYKEYEVNKDRAEKIISFQGKAEKFLLQRDVFKILKSYKIPIVKTVNINRADELESAASKIGYPLVLKIDAPRIIHKTEVSGVSINLKDKPELIAAFKKMEGKFSGKYHSFVLQEYLEGGIELIIGSKGNKDLKPTIMFGFGGIFAEVIRDVQFRLAPLSWEEGLEMIHSVKGFPVLGGERGRKPVDIHKLAEILVRLSQLSSDFPEISEIDLNPVIAFSKGRGAVVVDAKIKKHKFESVGRR